MAAYAIIGFGCAGYHALTAIRDADTESTIDIYSEHPDPPYNPMLTTYYASNRLRYEGMFPFGNSEDIAFTFKANVFSNTRVTGLNAADREITLEDGTRRRYDGIVLATGARSFTPPITNECPEACISMRTLDNARDLKRRLEHGDITRAVVVGASMAGIKVVEVLHNNGIPTTLADMAPHIFPLAAYADTAHRIEKSLSAQGVSLKFSAGLKAIRKGTETETIVECSDGTLLPADLVGLCIGTRANTDLAVQAGLAVGRGITVDPSMATSAPGIYAAGDCCEGCNLQNGQPQIIGLWANAAYQGYTAGANMCGSRQSFSGNILHNITHFFGMDFIGFGDNRIQGEKLSFENKERDLWIEAVRSDGRLAGINILGSYRISGILKNHILGIIQNQYHPIADMQRGILKQEGLSEEFILQLEGGRHGN
ncbi:MAG: FAD-dependent oxidoreductase [Clostridiales bacterium]|nr:FAD-dependent oxidoreductase [Clostridiales bacterium]